MFFIRSFPCHLEQTEELALWLKEVSDQISDVPYNKLRFLVHEAFVNACKFSESSALPVIVVIRKAETIEIAVTDPGKGFELPDEVTALNESVIGVCWKLVFDSKTQVLARIETQNKIRFSLQQDDAAIDTELRENHRGLISILNAVQDLSYHYMPNSSNYLHISF